MVLYNDSVVINAFVLVAKYIIIVNIYKWPHWEFAQR